MLNGTGRENRTRNRRLPPASAQRTIFGTPSVLRNPHSPYAWLAEDVLESIHQASLQILEEIGLDFLDEEALAVYEPPPLDAAVRDALDDYVARRTRELAGTNLYG
jgi:trimethylamine:corrinoid methyltransferase-like protein